MYIAVAKLDAQTSRRIFSARQPKFSWKDSGSHPEKIRDDSNLENHYFLGVDFKDKAIIMRNYRQDESGVQRKWDGSFGQNVLKEPAFWLGLESWWRN